MKNYNVMLIEKQQKVSRLPLTKINMTMSQVRKYYLSIKVKCYINSSSHILVFKKYIQKTNKNNLRSRKKKRKKESF